VAASRGAATDSSACHRDPRLFEVVPLVQIGNETRLNRMPAEHLLGDGARRGETGREERTEKAEMLRCLILRHRDHRHVEMAANNFGDLPDRDTIITDAMQP